MSLSTRVVAPLLVSEDRKRFMWSVWFSPFRKCKTIFAGFIGLEDISRLVNPGGGEIKIQKMQLSS